MRGSSKICSSKICSSYNAPASSRYDLAPDQKYPGNTCRPDTSKHASLIRGDPPVPAKTVPVQLVHGAQLQGYACSDKASAFHSSWHVTHTHACILGCNEADADAGRLPPCVMQTLGCLLSHRCCDIISRWHATDTQPCTSGHGSRRKPCLPESVERGEPGKQHDNDAARPQEVLHGKGQPQDARPHNGSGVVECRIPPAMNQGSRLKQVGSRHGVSARSIQLGNIWKWQMRRH